MVLSREQIASILSLYHLGEPESFEGIQEGSINTAYWVRVGGQRYFLRITERKRIADMIYERELLAALHESDLPVPELIPNVAKGTFIPWSSRGRYVSLFHYMEGRELGVFEVRPSHVEDVAAFAARMHLATTTFARTRQNEFALAALEKKLARLQNAIDKRRLAQRFAPDLAILQAELIRQRDRATEDLPRGTVHGDLFVDNVKFKNGKLVGVIDFEMASTERLIWEIAVGINAWCWQPSAEQQGGPAGHFSVEPVGAFLRGYDQTRPLADSEWSALPDELRLAAARFAISRLIDFELKSLPPEQRVYKDYRHYMQRLRVLAGDGAEALISRARNEPQAAAQGAGPEPTG